MAKRKRVAKKAAKRRTSKKASAKTKHPRARKPVAERSPLSKLDPMLRRGASRAKIEARFQTRALEVSAVRPQAVSGLSLGIHSLASRMSPVGAERLHKEDLVSVVIDCSAGERVRESGDEWGGCGTRGSPSTGVARGPRTVPASPAPR